MHKFSISAHSIQYQKTRRGIAYQAQLLRDGIPVGTVYNDGHGGDTAVSGITMSHNTALLDEALANGHKAREFYLEQLMNEAEGIKS